MRGGDPVHCRIQENSLSKPIAGFFARLTSPSKDEIGRENMNTTISKQKKYHLINTVEMYCPHCDRLVTSYSDIFVKNDAYKSGYVAYHEECY